MTQAEREQKAREWLEKTGQVYWKGHDVAVSKTDIANVVALLADTERATLERVASETRRFTSGGAVAQWCKQQAKEIQP